MSALVPLLLVGACQTRSDAGGGAAPGATTTGTATTPTTTRTAATAVSDSGRAGAVSGTTAPTGPTAAPMAAAGNDTAIVRALYVNRFAAMSSKKMRHLLAVADTTEINAFVIDIKDEFGLNYNSPTPSFAQNAGTMNKVRDLKALVDTVRAHGVLPIARLVVFKDSVTARVHPEWTIRQQDGSIWRDHKGLAWVNPYHRELWEYNIGVAEEVVRMGFGEVQFDYIRFPEPYKSLPQQVFPDNKGQAKPEAIAEYLKTANARLDKLGVRTTADIFGLVTTVKGPLEVAQEWERLSPVTDVLLPMTYPSHYPRGSFGIKSPNADPYRTINIAISRARERDEKLGVKSAPAHVRPWLQAFTLGAPAYGPEEIRQQKQAVYDAGYEGWVLWNPGSNYDVFLPALEKTTASRRKAQPTAAPKVSE